MYNPRLILACCLTLLSTRLHAQEKPKPTPGDEMIFKYLAAETDKLSGKFMDGAKTLAQWQQKRPRLYQEYMDMLGLWPLPEKTPLMATITGSLEAHGVIVEKLHFQSKPGLYVTANLYRPKKVDKKLPAILYVCGHSNAGRDGCKSKHQDHGFWFANNGYVCIILDTLQLGEIPGVHHGTYGVYEPPSWDRKRPDGPLETRFWWHSRGYTPAGVECWNGVRAIDYLTTRPEVDAEKIGVTGISGGGAATFWIAAADDRVKVAVPVSGMSDLESYVKNKVINGHCDCMFLHNTYQWEWTTIAAMIAPRPLLFANSDMDPIFPMDANRRIIARLRDCYTMHGQPDLVDEFVSKGGHAYRPDLRVAIFKFINKHLKGDTTTPVEDSAKYTPLPGKDLRVFPTDAELPKDVLNGKIDETFVPRAIVKLPEKGRFEEWKKGMIAKLREQSFRPFPEKIPAATQRPGGGVNLGRATLIYETEDHVKPIILTVNPFSDDQTRRSLLIVNNWKELGGVVKSYGKFLPGIRYNVYPRGSESDTSWTALSPPNYVQRSHALLGRTVDQGPVWDTLAAYADMDPKRKENWRIVGNGQSGVFAAYAALLEPSIKEIVVINPPKSHMEGPHFLNVLRVLDIPEALGLLAPRPLTIIGGKDPAFDRTAEIYRLAGAADKLTRK